MSGLAVVGILLLVTALLCALDPWPFPDEPSAAERRAWYAKRLARRRGEDV